MSKYLTDLAQVLRSAGLSVVEVGGWQTRARGSGGYASGRPTHLMWHHTASNTTPANDANYICHGSPDKPLANLLFARDGSVWVCAAGATNTNGKGQDTWGGGVPDDSMNLYAIGCEIANTGTGEPYPNAQQNSVSVAAKVLGPHYGIPSHNHRAHFEWAPGRKIDPYGPSRWNGDVNTFWDMNRFRADLTTPTPLPPPVVPPSEGPTDMFIFIVTNGPGSSSAETWLLCSGTTLAHLVNGHAVPAYQKAGCPEVRSTGSAMTEGLIKTCRTTNSCPPEWRGTGWQTLWDAQGA